MEQRCSVKIYKVRERVRERAGEGDGECVCVCSGWSIWKICAHDARSCWSEKKKEKQIVRFLFTFVQLFLKRCGNKQNQAKQ